MKRFIKFLSLTLAFIFAMSGCQKSNAPLDPADTVQLITKGDGYAIVKSQNQLSYSDTAEYVLGFLEDLDIDLSAIEYDPDSIFSLSDSPAPAYGDIFPGQTVEDTTLALFNTSERKDPMIMQYPGIELKFTDNEGGLIPISGVFCGLPFYYKLEYSDSTSQLVTNDDGSISEITDENVTLRAIALRFYRAAYNGRELETFVALRDKLTGLLGSAKNYDGLRYNPYVDYKLDEMPPLEELPNLIAVTWQIDRSLENPYHYVRLSLLQSSSGEYPILEIALV